MQRQIISIDIGKCNGCGQCVTNCPEGAIQIIDNKARLISDLLCDGLGACIGKCPVEAITTEIREAQPYDERQVMDRIIPQGINTLLAHLSHLKDHNQHEYHAQALQYLKEKDPTLFSRIGEEKIGKSNVGHSSGTGGCPGSRSLHFDQKKATPQTTKSKVESALSHWPVQLHLINPNAPHFKNSSLLIAADCVAYALGDFHTSFLQGKTLAIACPKLDRDREAYIQKIRVLAINGLASITVAIMEVPCCRGLAELVREALVDIQDKVATTIITVGIQGEIVRTEALQ